MKTYNSYKELVETMRMQITTKPNQTVAALIRIYKNQWADEKKTKEVLFTNGIGFKPQDSRILSSMAEQAIRKGTLSAKQIKWVADLIGKYAGQLVDGSIAEGKIKKIKKGMYVVE